MNSLTHLSFHSNEVKLDAILLCFTLIYGWWAGESLGDLFDAGRLQVAYLKGARGVCKLISRRSQM